MASTIDVLILASAAAALPALPVRWGDSTSWYKLGSRSIAVEMWSDEVSAFTGIKLLAAQPKPVTIVADDVDGVTSGADTLTVTGHALKTGDGPVRFTTSGTLPGGLALATDYWVGVVDANTIKLFATRAALLSGGTVALATAVDITSAGTGTHTLAGTAGSERMRWSVKKILGPAADGAVALDVSLGEIAKAEHSRRTVAYALVGTVSSGKMSASLYLEEG